MLSAVGEVPRPLKAGGCRMFGDKVATAEQMRMIRTLAEASMTLHCASMADAELIAEFLTPAASLGKMSKAHRADAEGRAGAVVRALTERGFNPDRLRDNAGSYHGGYGRP
jgi:hypothetical protein